MAEACLAAAPALFTTRAQCPLTVWYSAILLTELGAEKLGTRLCARELSEGIIEGTVAVEGLCDLVSIELVRQSKSSTQVSYTFTATQTPHHRATRQDSRAQPNARTPRGPSDPPFF